jgi:hypothetical protein
MSQFIDLVITEIKQLWSGVLMVKGSARHSQSNGGNEHVNRTVQAKLGSWMTENNSNHWSVGCMIVQWQYNTSFHSGIRAVSYFLTYGQQPRMGISNLPIHEQILSGLATEQEIGQPLGLGQTVSPAAAAMPLPIEEDVIAAATANLQSEMDKFEEDKYEEFDLDVIGTVGKGNISDPEHPEFGLKPRARSDDELCK